MGNDKLKERCQQLITAAVDGELAPGEEKELEQLLGRFPELRKEFHEFKSLKEVTKSMKIKSPDPEFWQVYWQNVYNRIERGLAWFLFTIGAGILITYGLVEGLLEILRDPNLSVIVKIGIFSLVLGLVMLLLSVIREKHFRKQHERYKEVQQ